MKSFTIGVYNSTKQEFFGKLSDNKIDTFCDIRQRRGVRGAQYAFVNSQRLQETLKELNINYWHVANLAPQKEIRELQKKADLANKEAKRQRKNLGEAFTSEYKNRVLKDFDFQVFLNELEDNGANRIALFCVEEKPEACHRSLVSDRLRNDFNLETIHQ
ncbi:MAG: DUF488 domain-containing protein [Cytophagales bacterium]|nr:DUF488 domain-containing protein [Cytophagales bacterium]